MPYFKWQGIDLKGKDRRGAVFARSIEHLDAMLLRRDIALTYCSKKKPLIVWPMSLQIKINFFERLAVLLEAGVRLPQALAILSESIEHPSAQEIILDIEQRVQSGQLLHDSLKAYPRQFNPMMIHMINVGFTAGALPIASKMLAMHLDTRQKFYKKIRAAALVPALTFLFFISIALVIFIVIMPLFSSIFESMGREIPTITKWVLSLSSFFRSSRGFFLILSFLIVPSLIYCWLGKARRNEWINRIALVIPGLSNIVVMTSCFSFFQSVAILLEGGMQLVPSLKIGNETINNHIIRAQIVPMIQSVASGSSLNQALVLHQGPFSRSDIEAMVMIGHEAGQLPAMLSRIADDYKERIEQKLSFYSALFQPIVMILLGIFIALLIIAVYIPILSLSAAIS